MIQEPFLFNRLNQVDDIPPFVNIQNHDVATHPVQSSLDDVTDHEGILSSIEKMISNEEPFFRESRLWELLQERKMRVDALCRSCEQQLPPSVAESSKEGVSSYQRLMQEHEILSEQVDRVLLESRQQREKESQEFTLFTNTVKNLARNVENLRDQTRSVCLQISHLIHNYQRVEERVLEGKRNEIAFRAVVLDEMQRALEHNHNQGNQRPSQINNVIKDSMREAASFLWNQFTNIAWNTIEAISNIWKSILHFPKMASSYLSRKLSVVTDRTHFSLAIPGIPSGRTSTAVGVSFTFGVTIVAGYFLIKRGIY